MNKQNCDTCGNKKPCDRCRNFEGYPHWVAIKTGSTEEATHYMLGNIQSIEIIQQSLTPEEFIGYCKGNVLKYRLRKKGTDREDAGKSAQFAEWLCQAMDGKIIIPGGK